MSERIEQIMGSSPDEPGAQADGAAVGGEESAGGQELEDMRTRMEELRVQAAAEVEEAWQTSWRSPDVFALKVQTRLTMNTEYRALQDKVRAIEATLRASS